LNHDTLGCTNQSLALSLAIKQVKQREASVASMTSSKNIAQVHVTEKLI
jgi:hypothetical protein